MAIIVDKKMQDNIWKISIEGDLDINTSNELKIGLNDLLDENEINMELDFEKLSYIDSTGLGVLIGILKRIKKNENMMVIKNPKKNVLKLFKITGLDKIFELK